jgi:ATP-binding cassette, subfamily C (CFTR/MRP), member 1
MILHSIDIETDRLIQDVVKEQFKACTVITIAHRLNTIIDSDRIAFLDYGELIECDTPANLLDRQSRFKIFYGAYSNSR